jgi:biofilm PGA synthesis protein PgaD
MVVRNGYVELVHRLGFYTLIIFCLGASLLLWAYYNYFRFRGIERRKERPRVTIDELSEHYRIAAEELERWRRSRRLVIHHSADGRVEWAD